MVLALWRYRWRSLLVIMVVGAVVLAWRIPRMPRILQVLRFVFDLLPDSTAIFLALLLAAVGIALLFLPEEIKRLEDHRRVRVTIAAILLAIAVVFGVSAVISDLVQKQEDKEAGETERKEAKKERDRLAGQISDLLGRQKLATTQEELLRTQINKLTRESMPESLGDVRHIAKPRGGPKPDVSLRFVYAKEPALIISNRSDAIARQMRWTVAVWNMDLPDRNDPLPIPVSAFDWLRPHTDSGPENLFGSPSVASLLKSGNHLFGSASVICPECVSGRTFLVYIVWGFGGWFSEIEGERSGNVLIPTNFLKETREAYFKQLESIVPEKSRIPIGER